MYYLTFLDQLHRRLEPRTYLEIGIRNGDSLALCRRRGIGVDPDFSVTTGQPGEISLIRSTSDEYFASIQEASVTPFPGMPVDMAFIDGMHLVEFALRDFINVERYSSDTSLIVFDDILPTDHEMASRDRHTQAWTGDVFKILDVLAITRPDLTLLRVNTQPTGLLLVCGLCTDDTALSRDIDLICAEQMTPDPQRVPDDILTRHRALDPEIALALPLWDLLRSSRAVPHPDLNARVRLASGGGPWLRGEVELPAASAGIVSSGSDEHLHRP